MQKNFKFDNLSILVGGQVLTSRTETLENYLKDRVKYLGIIGFSSPYAVKGLCRYSLYENSLLSQEFSFPSIVLKGPRWFTQPLLAPIFALYFIFIIIAYLKLKRKFDIFIGIACFSALVGLFLKQMGMVKYLIYYTIDYYPLPKKFCFNTLINRSIWFLDKVLVKKANVVWNISPRIVEAREKFAQISATTYKSFIAPMAYSSEFLRERTFDKIERWSIGFVGSLSENQDLQLLVRAMPEIIKELPGVRVKIIGKGPYENELKELIREFGLEEYFIFYGFIRDDNEVLDILSSCAIGIAPWICEEDNNVLYADPGKPKLYAFCGLPTIITNRTLVAKEISEKKAGISINYDENELVRTIIKLLKDENRLKEYKRNAYKFAMDYTTDKVFNSVIAKTIEALN